MIVEFHLNKLLVRLVERDGKLVCDFATDLMKEDVDRWLTRGLLELVGPQGQRRPRTTLPTDPDFIPRLISYVEKLGLIATIYEEKY